MSAHSGVGSTEPPESGGAGSAGTGARSGALEAVDRILNRGGGLDEVVAVLHERVFAWVGVEGTAIEAGERPAEPSLRAGALAAEPREPSPADGPLLERVALLVSHLVPR